MVALGLVGKTLDGILLLVSLLGLVITVWFVFSLFQLLPIHLAVRGSSGYLFAGIVFLISTNVAFRNLGRLIASVAGYEQREQRSKTNESRILSLALVVLGYGMLLLMRYALN